MRDYSELLAELRLLEDNENHAEIFRQAVRALEQLMCDEPELAGDWPFPGEPSDLYVMSRGKAVS